MTHQGPPDFNEIVHRVVAMVTSDDPAEEPQARHVEVGRTGGVARAVALNSEERSAIATWDTVVRWAQPSV